ncbi:MAG: ureidoglycolate lyase [Pusillimonas sp.]|nr:ureidoglycolate lyase [Pusillimonas sp.]
MAGSAACVSGVAWLKKGANVPNVLKLEPLTKEAFAPFGDVICTRGNASFPINNGTTQRYHHVGKVQVHGEDGQAGISLAVGGAFSFPINIAMLERHPLGSQAWIPAARNPFVVVVAPNGANDRPDENGIRAFYAEGDQGVNYYAGVWHHPLLSLGQQGDFIVVDRIGSAPNCDECDLNQIFVIDGTYEQQAAV